MPIDQGLSDALGAIDAATTRLGTSVANVATNVDGVSIRVWALVQELGTKPSAAELVAFKAAMDSETSKLDSAAASLDTVSTVLGGIGADMQNPVPTPPPDVPVDPTPVPPETPAEG